MMKIIEISKHEPEIIDFSKLVVKETKPAE